MCVRVCTCVQLSDNRPLVLVLLLLFTNTSVFSTLLLAHSPTQAPPTTSLVVINQPPATLAKRPQPTLLPPHEGCMSHLPLSPASPLLGHMRWQTHTKPPKVCTCMCERSHQGAFPQGLSLDPSVEILLSLNHLLLLWSGIKVLVIFNMQRLLIIL